MSFHLTKRFEALLVGPLITGLRLTESLEELSANADRVYGVVVNLHQMKAASKLIRNLGLGIPIAPIAYPLGNLPLDIKLLQASQALDAGAGGLDFVVLVEYLKSGQDHLVEAEIQAMVELAGRYRASLTCIAPLELISIGEQQRAAALALQLGADLQTATGLGADTSLEALAKLRKQAAPELRLVACGAIRLFEQALDFFNAGATCVCTADLAGVFNGFSVLSYYGLMGDSHA